MNLIALLLEMLFGRRWRMQPVPVRPIRRNPLPDDMTQHERDFVRSDACTLAALSWLTGSNPSVDPDAFEERQVRHFDPYPALARRSWSG